MQENDLYNALVNGARHDRLLLNRIVDGSVGKKPFDFFGVDSSNGNAIAVEAKIWKHPSTLGDLPVKLFEKHQLNWLRTYALIPNTLSLAVIYHAYERKMYVWDFRLDRWVEPLRNTGQGWRGWPKA